MYISFEKIFNNNFFVYVKWPSILSLLSVYDNDIFWDEPYTTKKFGANYIYVIWPFNNDFLFCFHRIMVL